LYVTPHPTPFPYTTLFRSQQDLVGRHAPLHEQVVDGEVQLHRVDPEADGEGALRVEVDEQDTAAVLGERGTQVDGRRGLADAALDRKSTRLNSSHVKISYA